MSVDSNSVKLDENSSLRAQDNNEKNKRLNQEANESDHADDGEIDLEEGEIEDDDDDLIKTTTTTTIATSPNTNNSTTTTASIYDPKKSQNYDHKKKYKHRNHKRRKKHNQTREKRLKSELNDNCTGDSFIEFKTNQQPKSLLSIPLNDDNLIKANYFQNKDSDEDSDSTEDDESMDDSNDDDEDDSDTVDADCDDKDENTNDSINATNQTAKSLFELLGPNAAFIDPTITEKENSKPLLAKLAGDESATDGNKKKLSKKEKRELKRKRKESGIISKKTLKKMEKKRKYAEMAKENKKQEWKDKIAETICKFYLEGRCTKGNECPFSHNAQINKKYEVCKYYLNGFCAKNNNCTYMHSEFPCKFYHTNKECLNDVNCRFSHSPMNDQMRDAFEKYLKECDDTPPSKKPSLLGSPPRHLKDQQDKLAEHTKKITTTTTTTAAVPRVGLLPLPNVAALKPPQQTNIPSLLSKPIPSLMDISIGPKPLVPQPLSIMSNLNDIKPIKPQQQQQPTLSPFFSQDIDERCPPPSAPPAIPSVPPPAPLLTQITDIDERATNVAPPQTQHQQLITNLLDSNLDPNNLLVKLLQQQQKQQQNQLQSQIVTNLLTTLSASVSSAPTLLPALLTATTTNTIASLTTQPPVSKPLTITQPAQSQPPPITSETILNNLLKLNPETSSNDSHESNYLKTNKLTIDETVEIDARTDGKLPYNIQPIDVEPSSLWTNPPVLNSSSRQDSECDPRIEFYSNKLNNKHLNENIKNQNLINQSSQLITSSPSLLSSPSTASALSPPQTKSPNSNDDSIISSNSKSYQNHQPKSTSKDYRDPRLSSKLQVTNNNDSLPTATTTSMNDLLNMQNQLINSRTSSSSLLSSLPDLKLPALNTKTLLDQQQQQQQQTSQASKFSIINNDANNVVKLSIEDYKRKLQKTTNTSSYDDYSNQKTSKPAASNAQQQPQSYAPQIPSYSVTNITNSLGDITPPQSLHELLKNFPS